LSSKVAVVRPADLKYYTKTRDFTDVHVIGGRKAYADHDVRCAALRSSCLISFLRGCIVLAWKF
jgi:hypothetical protein